MGKPKVIAATLVENNGKFLFSKEILESGKEYWVVPGGSVEFGETLEEAAMREIKEETDLDIELTDLIGHKEVITPEYDYHTVIFFFHAKPLHTDIETNEELLDARFMTKEEALDTNLIHSAKWLLNEHF